MKNACANKKSISTNSKSLFNLVIQYRGLFALLAVVALLLAVPLMKQKAQVEPTTERKEKVQKEEQSQKEETNEVSVVSLSELGHNEIPTEAKTETQRTIEVATQATEVEPNGTPATASPIGTSVRVVGNLFPNGDIDFYSFNANAGDRVYSAIMTSFSAGNSTDSQLTLLASDGTTVIEFDDDNGSFAALSSSIAGAIIPTTGTYYLKVNDFTAGTSSEKHYELWLNVQSGAPTPEVEGNDTPATANPLPSNGWVSGARNPAAATEQDWYSITLNAGDTVFLSLDVDPEDDLTVWNGRLGFALFGDAGNQILVVDDAGTGDVSPNPNRPSEAMFMTVKNAGTYFAFVDSASAAVGGPTATYHLNVSVLPKINEGINCTTYTSTDVPKTIGPGTGLVSSTITVPGNPRIADIDVDIVLNHALMQDIDAHLRSPAGNDNGLFTDIGAAAIGGQQQMNVVFDDEAGIPPAFTAFNGTQLKPENNSTAGTASTSGAYRLSWFDGENAGGTWTLDLRDDTAGANGGTLTAWSLRICEQPPTTGTTIFSTDFESGAAGFTHSGTQDEWELGLPATVATTTANPVAAFNNCSSGVNCWKTDLDNTYNNSSSQDLLSPNINLAGHIGPITLEWAMRHQIETANFDHANVTVREVGNPSNSLIVWQWLDPTPISASAGTGNPQVNIGGSVGWGVYKADISSFAGKNIEVVFHLDSDSSVAFGGWAIDDVKVNINPATPNKAVVDFDGDGKSDPAVIVGPFPFAGAFKDEEVIVVGGDILARERQRIWTDSYQRLLHLRSGRGFVDLPKDVQQSLWKWQNSSTKNPFENLQTEAGLMWQIRQSSNGATLTYMLGTNTDIIVPCDYDGDGKTDPAVFTKSTGMFTVIFSSDMSTHTYALGTSTSDPTVVGDYDGDGKCDPAVYDVSTGLWSYLGGTNHDLLTQVTFGANGIPAPGDYDGDGKFDFGIQVPPISNASVAKFRIAYNDGSVQFPDLGIAYGLATFAIVPGDYDGDGKIDIAQANYFASPNPNIVWRVLQSSTGYTVQVKTDFGLVSSDRTVQGDYDGDGKTDLAVYRAAAAPNDGVFIILQSSTSTTVMVDWGGINDYPIAFFNTH